jgi:hypothetical protein
LQFFYYQILIPSPRAIIEAVIHKSPGTAHI